MTQLSSWTLREVRDAPRVEYEDIYEPDTRQTRLTKRRQKLAQRVAEYRDH